jgi:resuscitation-promoting factor RpfA
MRSGNGRHRRPRQAPAIVVAAGVTGAGIAIPLFGAAGGAQAAENTTWDRVAECESGGMWSANSGNGFYGGLQLSLDMWKESGGADYAPRPDLASRSQQITVAESILGDRGPDAWPSCALDAGLTDGADAPDVDPGATAPPWGVDQRGDADGGEESDEPDGSASETSEASETPESSETSPESGKTEAPGTSESSDGAEDSTSSASPSSDPSASPSSSGGDEGREGSSADPTPTGRHRGEGGAGEDESDGRSTDPRPSGRHASRDAADHTGGHEREDYTVRPGDNLSVIARTHRLSGGWHELYASNERLIGADPDLILPGQRLDLSIKGQ